MEPGQHLDTSPPPARPKPKMKEIIQPLCCNIGAAAPYITTKCLRGGEDGGGRKKGGSESDQSFSTSKFGRWKASRDHVDSRLASRAALPCDRVDSRPVLTRGPRWPAARVALSRLHVIALTRDLRWTWQTPTSFPPSATSDDATSSSPTLCSLSCSLSLTVSTRISPSPLLNM